METPNKWIDSHYKEIVSFTQKIIQINSVNGNETEVAKAIQEKLEENGIKSRLIGKDNKRLNLVAKLEGRSHNKSLGLCGHMDTVPLGETSKWKYHPLSGKLIDDKIYGRGSQDMKGGCVAALFALMALKKAKTELNGNLYLLLTADEESGNHYGIRHLIKHGPKINACIVCEPMSRKSIRIGSRGMYRFEIITKGKTGHTGSRKKTGINAVTKMAKVLLELEKTKPRYKKHPDFPPPRITPGTVISGGRAVNIYPDYCKALVDCRLSYGQTKASKKRDIKQVIGKLKKRDKEITVKINEISHVPPVVIPKDSKIIKCASKQIKKILGFRPTLKISSPVTDGNLLVASGIPAIVFGTTGRNAHSENEYVDARSIVNIAKVYALTIIDFLK